MAIPSDFYINFERFKFNLDKSIDWLINSWEFKHENIDWQICRLKHKKYHKIALKYLKRANKYLNG